MAHSQSTNTTTIKTQASGTFNPRSGRIARPIQPAPPKVALPKILPYPQYSTLQDASTIVKDKLCYIIKDYGDVGISVVISRNPKQDKVLVLCGDWHGNALDLEGDITNKLVQAALVFIQQDLPLFIKTMSVIKLNQTQFFFALNSKNELTLVDMQISLNKLVGPGMIRDIFGKIYNTQEIVKVESLDDRAFEYIEKGAGSYEGDLIIKPSKFTTFSPLNGTTIIPLYIRVKR